MVDWVSLVSLFQCSCHNLLFLSWWKCAFFHFHRIVLCWFPCTFLTHCFSLLSTNSYSSDIYTLLFFQCFGLIEFLVLPLEDNYIHACDFKYHLWWCLRICLRSKLFSSPNYITSYLPLWAFTWVYDSHLVMSSCSLHLLLHLYFSREACKSHLCTSCCSGQDLGVMCAQSPSPIGIFLS